MFTDRRRQRQTNHNTTILCLLTEDNDNPIIIRPHTDGRQQRQPKHNTTQLCLLTDVTTVMIRPHIVFTDGPTTTTQYNTTTYYVY